MREGLIKPVCEKLYGYEQGRQLARVMNDMRKLDLCVATAFSSTSLSVALSCSFRGRVFRVTADYGCMYFPDESLRPIDTIKFRDLAGLLPKKEHSGDDKNCMFDVRKFYEMMRKVD